VHQINCRQSGLHQHVAIAFGLKTYRSRRAYSKVTGFKGMFLESLLSL
jgi:hypothetical protein